MQQTLKELRKSIKSMSSLNNQLQASRSTIEKRNIDANKTDFHETLKVLKIGGHQKPLVHEPHFKITKHCLRI